MMTGRVPVRGEVISHPSGYDFEGYRSRPKANKKITGFSKITKKIVANLC
jgi:magnesium and cobalt transporter